MDQDEKQTTTQAEAQTEPAAQKTFGQAMTELLKQKGITRREVEADTGFSVSMLSWWATDRSRPTVAQIQKLDAYLGSDLASEYKRLLRADDAPVKSGQLGKSPRGKAPAERAPKPAIEQVAEDAMTPAREEGVSAVDVETGAVALGLLARMLDCLELILRKETRAAG